MINGFLLDATARTALPSSADEDNLSEALGVSSITLAMHSVGGANFCFVCDDEAKLHPNPVLSAVDSFGRPVIYGSFFVCNYDEEDDSLINLSKKQVTILKRYLSTYYDDFGTLHPQIEGVEPPEAD